MSNDLNGILMKRLSYSGIGSRQTPQEVCEYFTEIASILEEFRPFEWI